MDNFIKYHKTEIDKQGNYREYSVYKKDNIFVFQCFDWQIRKKSRHGIRKMYDEYKNKEDAIRMYEACFMAWE